MACSTGSRPVGLQPRRPGLPLRTLELLWDSFTPTRAHLIGRSQKGEQQSDDCAQNSYAALEGQDVGLKPSMVHVQDIRRDDGSVVSTSPTQCGRARNAELGDDFWITYDSHEVPKTMIVRPVRPDGRTSHSPIVTGHQVKASLTEGTDRKPDAGRDPTGCRLLERKTPECL